MITRVVIPLERWEKSRHRLAGGAFMAAVKSGILSGTMRCVPEMHKRTRNAPPANPAGIGSGGAVNTGAYLQRWQAVPTAEGARLINSSPYSGIIEHGARPMGARAPRPRGTGSARAAQPMSKRMRALQRWVELRLGVPKSESRGVAFLVGRAIARRGLLGRKVMTGDDNVANLNRIVMLEVVHEVDSAIERSYR